MEKRCEMEVKRKYVSEIESLLKDVENKIADRRLIFWGGGNTAKIYWSDIEKAGIKPCYWIDNGVKSEGLEQLAGYPIYTSAKLREEEGDYVVVVFSMNPSTYQSIRKNAEEYTEYICSADALYYLNNLEAVTEFLLSLNDEKSVESLGEALKCRIMGEWNPSDIVKTEQYFPFHNFIRYSEQEVYADLGAFKGDTMEKYMFMKYGVFKQYYAFEPLPGNYEAMQYRAERLEKEWGLKKGQIICENVGCGREKGEFVIRYNSGVAATALPFNADEEVRVPVITLDDYFKDINVSVIKMDIEGMEYEVLEGSQNIIKRDRPILAVCIYHKLSDIVDIPRLIQSFGMQYKFDVRCYSESFAETVLYAW